MFPAGSSSSSSSPPMRSSESAPMGTSCSSTPRPRPCSGTREKNCSASRSRLWCRSGSAACTPGTARGSSPIPERVRWAPPRALWAAQGRRQEFSAEISLSSIEDEEGTLSISAIRDVTHRAEADRDRRELAAELVQTGRVEAAALVQTRRVEAAALVQTRRIEAQGSSGKRLKKAVDERHRSSPGCASPGAWRASASSPAGSPTTSTTSSA